MRYWGAGPPQVWQLDIHDRASYISPLGRLHRAARWGLPVGKGCQLRGGLQTNVALKMERQGLAFLHRNESGDIVKAFACQYHFDFVLCRGWRIPSALPYYKCPY